jgi:hypothetical protein
MVEVFGLPHEAAKNAIGVKEPVDCLERLGESFIMWTLVQQNSGTIILKRYADVLLQLQKALMNFCSTT